MTVLLPQAGEEQIGVSTSSTGDDRRTASRCSTCCTGSPTTHRLAALHQHRAVRRGARPRGRDAAGAAVASTPTRRTAGGTGRSCPRSCPSVVRSFFRVSARREDTFVAGLSMGGYGALKWALHQPERFAAAASLSGRPRPGEPQPCAGPARAAVERVFDGRSGPRTTCSRCSPPPTSTRCRRSTSGAAPRTTCTTATCGSSTRRWPPGSTCTWTSGPASTSGGCGTRPSSDVLAWLPTRSLGSRA